MCRHSTTCSISAALCSATLALSTLALALFSFSALPALRSFIFCHSTASSRSGVTNSTLVLLCSSVVLLYISVDLASWWFAGGLLVVWSSNLAGLATVFWWFAGGSLVVLKSAIACLAFQSFQPHLIIRAGLPLACHLPTFIWSACHARSNCTASGGHGLARAAAMLGQSLTLKAIHGATFLLIISLLSGGGYSVVVPYQLLHW